MKRIYITQARRLLAEAVETRGRDFVYNNSQEGPRAACYYTPQAVFQDNRALTGCLIGTALKKAQVPDEILKKMGGYIYSEVSSELQEYTISKEALDYFTIAQKIQDSGETWGEAFDAAERSLEDKPYRTRMLKLARD